MFDKIENPTTGRFVNTNSKLGKTIINQYLYILNSVVGGAVTDAIRIPKRLKNIMDLNRFSREEAEVGTIKDVIENTDTWLDDPNNKYSVWESKEGQNIETIREMLNLNDWKIRKVIDIYEENREAQPGRLNNYQNQKLVMIQSL